MENFSFKALGTTWSLLVDAADFPESDREALFRHIDAFEKRFSRFLSDTEVNQFRNAEAGEYQISEEFSRLLQRADTLRTLTGGIYDPAMGELLEHAGYDQNYRLTPDSQVDQFVIPKWSLQGNTLSLERGIAFDLGGIGKGYAIDLAATFLREHGYQYFLVEAGGDMYGTSKSDGSAFEIALEWPGKPDTAFGKVALKNTGLAASDSFRRRWKDWHHIIDPYTKKPIEKILGVTALAPTAFAADCLTSGLFLSGPEQYPKIAKEFGGEFVVFTQDGKVQVSESWPGEFFK